MEPNCQDSKIKSLFVIVNAGFSSDIVDIARAQGARGATIINSRGWGASHEVFMGITVDSEKEIIICIAEESISEKIVAAIKEKAGYESPAHSVCFVTPVEKAIGIGGSMPQAF